MAQPVSANRTCRGRLGERRAGRNDNGPTRFRAPAETLEPAQRTAQRLVHPADLVHAAVLQHGNAGIRQQAGDFLALAQHVALDDRHHLIGQGLADQGQELGDAFFAGRQAVVGMAVGALDDQGIGMRQLGPLGGERGLEFEIARVKQRAALVFGQQHRRAEAMPGRVGRQAQPCPVDRLAIGQFERGRGPSRNW